MPSSNTTATPLLLLALAAYLSAGCSQDPRARLEEMSRVYRQARAYADDGRLRVQYKRGDTQVDQTIPFRVAFERPNKIRIDCYDAMVVSDGTTLFAAVGNVPGQVLTEAIVSPLSLDQLFADEQLRTTLAEGDAGCPTQLPLLLADDTIDLILADALEKPSNAGTETVDGRRCVRLQVKKPDGLLELWIDTDSKLLRRLSLPTISYARLLSEQSGAVTGLKVVVDFINAKFPEAIPEEAFVFEVPAGASRVASLEPVPIPQLPSSLIGKQVAPFTLNGLDGKTISRDSLKGTTCVFEFFFTGCQPCKRTVPLIAKALQPYEQQPHIRHYAVSVDEIAVPDDVLQKIYSDSGGTGTILRDPRAVAAEALEIEAFPAVVVIGSDGTVADIQCGYHSHLGQDVVATLAAVAQGTPAAPRVQERFEMRLHDYEQVLAQAAGQGISHTLPAQEIAPRQQPIRFKLIREWRANSVDIPGNVVCIESIDADQTDPVVHIVALDGWRTVSVLDSHGQELSRHELKLPQDASLGFLRTAIDATGSRWWLGGAVGSQQVFLFDSRWKLQIAYPSSVVEADAGISDAQLVDCDGSGSPQIVVGWCGSAGVERIGLDGQRVWQDRSIAPVLGVAMDGPREDGRRGVVCVDGRGRLVRIAPDGTAGEPHGVCDQSGRPMVASALVSGPVGPDGAWAMVALAVDALDGLPKIPASSALRKNTAVGIGPMLEPLWHMQLPSGIHRGGPLQPLAWADLLGTPRRQWLIAAPDGSVAVAWADGRVVDRYQHGAAMVGIGGYRSNGVGHIVVATRDGLESFRLDDIALD